MRSILAVALAGTLIASAAQAADSDPWYMSHPHVVRTLKQALDEEHAFLGSTNPGYRMRPDTKTCAALRSVMVACDYNTRGTLSMFLAVNGKGLFPAKSHTNPYYLERDREEQLHDGIPWPDDGFIGHGKQNAMLTAAVRRNAKLFHNGDLRAIDVRTRWR